MSLRTSTVRFLKGLKAKEFETVLLLVDDRRLLRLPIKFYRFT